MNLQTCNCKKADSHGRNDDSENGEVTGASASIFGDMVYGESHSADDYDPNDAFSNLLASSTSTLAVQVVAA